ncbi:MAG: InlB B-repeat-containing protein [Clostridia bacterium]|nr:InlB B-repeat-containing protein [Clostridia bacterium]
MKNVRKLHPVCAVLVFCLLLTGLVFTRAEADTYAYTWPLPVSTGYVTNSFSSKHIGTDFHASIGTEIYSIASGTVIKAIDNGCTGSHNGSAYAPVCTKAGCGGSYGNYIVISHGNNVYSLYAHLKTGSFRVSVNQTVSQGQLIALSGNAGNTKGAHLHLEFMVGGLSQGSMTYNKNSENYLTKVNVNPVIPDNCNCSTSYAGYYTVNVNSTLHLRDGHGTNFASLRSIPNGTTLYVTKSDGEWAHTTYDGAEGCVKLSYLTLNQPDPNPGGDDSYLFHPLVFDVNFYRAANYSDLGSFTDDQLRSHWKNNGVYEGRRSSAVFRVSEYVNYHYDLKSTYGSNYIGAIRHFVDFGIAEGRSSCEEFHFDKYKANYGDLQNAFESNNYDYYAHYINCGRSEGRIANARLHLVFDPNGGSVSPSSIEITTGRPYGSLPVPVRSGYLFEGWYTQKSGGTLVTASTNAPDQPHADRTVYAHWAVNSCTVTFDAGAMTTVSPESKTVTPGGAYGALPVPVQALVTGDIFDGWYYEDNLITSTSIVNVSVDHTLTARWRGASSIATFDPCGGTLPVGSLQKTVVQGLPYGVLPEPVKEGCLFDHWELRSLPNITIPVNKEVTRDTIVVHYQDHTLYAVYTPLSYTITYDYDGTNRTTRIRSYGDTYGDKLGDPPFYFYEMPFSILGRTGYTFAGWETENGVSVTGSTTLVLARDHTVYGRWTPNTYQVLFKYGYGTGDVLQTTVTYGKPYGTLPWAIKEGYTFGGWMLENGSIVTADTLVSTARDHELRAKWDPLSFTVSFDPLGGSSASSITVSYGETYGTLPSSTKRGHTFDGWYTQPEGGSLITETTTVSILADTVLYAHWTPMSFTLHFAANGGTVSPESKTVVFGSPYGELPVAYKEGYVFSGWRYGGLTINEQTIFTTPFDTTVIAQWTPKQYAIIFSPGTGSGTAFTLWKNHNEDIILPGCTFAKEGHVFSGWALDPGSTTADYAAETAFSRNERTTLYAVWSPLQYTVSFDVNGADAAVAPIQVTHGGTYGSLPSVKRTGYEFKGWYRGQPDDASSVRVYSYTPVKNENHTLTASWQLRKWLIVFHPNGGTFSIEAVWKTWGVPISLPEDIPEKTGYRFVGWSLNSTGTQPDYLPGGRYSTDTEEDHVMLYAIWEEIRVEDIVIRDSGVLFTGRRYALTEFIDPSLSGLTMDDLQLVSDSSVLRIRDGYLIAYGDGSASVTVSLAKKPDVSWSLSFKTVDLDAHMVWLPEALTEIEKEAFRGSSLVAVTIPDTCRTIGIRAFAGCRKLVWVFVPGTVTSISPDAFTGCPESLTIYTDSERIGQYAQQHGINWSLTAAPGT